MDLFDKEYLKSIDFKVVSDDSQCGKAESIRPKGKILLSWNREGPDMTYLGEPLEKCSYFGIEEDGGTRISFNGIVFNREDIEFILKRTV